MRIRTIAIEKARKLAYIRERNKQRRYSCQCSLSIESITFVHKLRPPTNDEHVPIKSRLIIKTWSEINKSKCKSTRMLANDEHVKKLADTISKFKLNPDEAERCIEVLRLKGWKRLFPRIFGL